MNSEEIVRRAKEPLQEAVVLGRAALRLQASALTESELAELFKSSLTRN
jgi:hypothetical protein